MLKSLRRITKTFVLWVHEKNWLFEIIAIEECQVGIPMPKQDIIEVDEDEGHVLQLDLAQECEKVFKLNLVNGHKKNQDLAQGFSGQTWKNQDPTIIMCEEALIETVFELVKTFHIFKVLF